MGYRFVDEATIRVRSGHGGAGAVSFRREKFVPKGGPDGGDGGAGGDVVVRADPQLSTLLDYKHAPRQFAANGQPGAGAQRDGKSGAEKVVRVPPGTAVLRADTGELLADLVTPGAQVVVARGGRGGKGNVHFKGPVRQTPRFAQPGEPGEELEIRLEVKLLADVGLIGFPNVGKSSLIARISAARPKIADYPFTTLQPNLGVVRVGAAQDLVVADVPGLIPGAHTGSGLGTRFLKHVERVSHLVHMVIALPEEAGETGRDPIADFEAIESELHAHNPELGRKPRVLVLNQMDLDWVAQQEPRVRAYAESHGLPFFAMSTATGAGVQALVNALGEAIAKNQESAE